MRNPKPPDRANYSYPSWPDKDRLQVTFNRNATDRVLLSTVIIHVRVASATNVAIICQCGC